MYSERNAKYIKQGWSQESASVSTPWYALPVACSYVLNTTSSGFLPLWSQGIARQESHGETYFHLRDLQISIPLDDVQVCGPQALGEIQG
jgi:hypothetical protein